MKKYLLSSRIAAILLAAVMLVAYMPAFVFADDPDLMDLGNGSVTFDESYRVLDDIEETPYPEYYYDVPYGTVLEPTVKDMNGDVVSPENYKASYTEMEYIADRYEWNMIDENNWLDAFPTEPGVYFCKVEGVDPYTGSYERIDLIRILEKPDDPDMPLDDETFERFCNVAGWYDHELFAGEAGFSFKVPCKNVADFYGTEFTKEDLNKVHILVSTVGGNVYESTSEEDPDYPGDYIYSFGTPALEWGDPYEIIFRNGDAEKTIKGTVKKNVKLTYSVSNLTYTGKALTPKITVKYGSTTLVKGRDYVLDADPGMASPKNVGTYGVYITSPLTSKYAIHETMLYKVNPKGTSISKVTAAKKAFTVKWKKQAAQTTGYQIQYGLKSNFKGAKTVTISKNSTVSKKITKLKAKKKYYIRIRTYRKVGRQTYYSAWSKTKTIKTK